MKTLGWIRWGIFDSDGSGACQDWRILAGVGVGVSVEVGAHFLTFHPKPGQSEKHQRLKGLMTVHWLGLFVSLGQQV